MPCHRLAARLAAAAAVISCGVLALVAGAAAAQPLTKLVFGTNWYAQAEHGGFYQAVAEDLYRKHGLDVQIRMGGPQVNGLQLLLAGQFDLFMGYDLQTLLAVEQDLPVVTVAAAFQKDPAVIIAHPGVAKLEELKGRPIAISAASDTTFWPWLRSRYGFDDAQKRPYAFSVQPFLVDKRLAQQGYVTSEPYSIEKGGVKPAVFLLADLGYPPYAQTVVVTRDTLAKRRDAVKRFVQASAEGWKSYLANPAAGNALIKRDNPQMEDDLIAFGLRKMKEYRIVTGGDAAKLGIMTMTDARWKRTSDFVAEAKTVKPGLDYRRAYTLELVREIKVLP
jgi:NitT/TauT family transport system substrate-binding protein